MLDLNDIFYFVGVVDQGGFAAASRGLGVPKSTLSYRIQMLERTLNVRLIIRSSREFRLTEAGTKFYRHSVAMLEHAQRAERAIKQRLDSPLDSVRITTSVAVAQFAMKGVVFEFIKQYPKIKIVEDVTDRFVDLIGENFDLAIRTHHQPSSSAALVHYFLGHSLWLLFASPDYLLRRGGPKNPDELPAHSSLFLMRNGDDPAWSLRRIWSGSMEERVLPLSPCLTSDNIVTLKTAALAGLGIVALPEYACRSELRSGRLARVLPEWLAGEAIISVLVPHKRACLPEVKALVDHLVTEFPKFLLPT